MSNIVKFYCKDSAKDPDAVLERAIGEYSEVIVIGYGHDGQIEARVSLGLDHKEINFVLDMFKSKLISGDYQ